MPNKNFLEICNCKEGLTFCMDMSSAASAFAGHARISNAHNAQAILGSLTHVPKSSREFTFPHGTSHTICQSHQGRQSEDRFRQSTHFGSNLYFTELLDNVKNMTELDHYRRTGTTLLYNWMSRECEMEQLNGEIIIPYWKWYKWKWEKQMSNITWSLIMVRVLILRLGKLNE